MVKLTNGERYTKRIKLQDAGIFIWLSYRLGYTVNGGLNNYAEATIPIGHGIRPCPGGYEAETRCGKTSQHKNLFGAVRQLCRSANVR